MLAFDLKPIHENVKSYYGKAEVLVLGDWISLWSYKTAVASYNTKTGDKTDALHKYSRTTDRHIREFWKQIDNKQLVF